MEVFGPKELPVERGGVHRTDGCGGRVVERMERWRRRSGEFAEESQDAKNGYNWRKRGDDTARVGGSREWSAGNAQRRMITHALVIAKIYYFIVPLLCAILPPREWRSGL